MPTRWTAQKGQTHTTCMGKPLASSGRILSNRKGGGEIRTRRIACTINGFQDDRRVISTPNRCGPASIPWGMAGPARDRLGGGGSSHATSQPIEARGTADALQPLRAWASSGEPSPTIHHQSPIMRLSFFLTGFRREPRLLMEVSRSRAGTSAAV
jgi:hypothetical protein